MNNEDFIELQPEVAPIADNQELQAILDEALEVIRNSLKRVSPEFKDCIIVNGYIGMCFKPSLKPLALVGRKIHITIKHTNDMDLVRRISVNKRVKKALQGFFGQKHLKNIGGSITLLDEEKGDA